MCVFFVQRATPFYPLALVLLASGAVRVVPGARLRFITDACICHTQIFAGLFVLSIENLVVCILYCFTSVFLSTPLLSA